MQQLNSDVKLNNNQSEKKDNFWWNSHETIVTLAGITDWEN